MAKSLVTDAGTLIIPGAYAKYKVVSNPSGLSTTGVLMLVGEADAGPDYTLEADLEENAFGPDQLADVITKYKSGPLVDAMRSAVAAANDPDIVGSFNRAILVKTNVSTKASGTLPKVGGGTYSVIADLSYGKLGNQILYQTVQAQAEVVPSTGAFTYIPNAGSVQSSWRVNGGTADSQLFNANESPSAFVTAVGALTGLAASGGVNRGIISVSGTLAVQADPPGTNLQTILLTRSVNWTVLPVVGDTLIIPTGSVIAGGSNVNVGAYVITAVTSATLTAVKLSDAGSGAAVPGVVTNPANVSAVSIAAVTDAQAWSPVTISLTAATSISGVGKSLEISEEAGGTDLLSRMFYELGTTTPATYISKTGAPQLLVSAAEREVTLNTSRSSDSVTESITAGGDIVLKLSYTGTTATVTITPTTLTTTVTGGTGGNLSLTLADYATVSDMVTYINTQTGYTASVGTVALGFLPPSALDQVVAAGICSDWGAQNGRIKANAYEFYTAVSQNSVLVQIGNPAAQPALGLPDVMSAPALLTGGGRGGTSDTQISNALLALEAVQGNFLVPLISRDATLDIADGLTDSSSTYTVAATHASSLSHVLKLSTFKRRRNRQAFLSIDSDFTTSKNTAANIASWRCSMTFQDFKQVGGDGSITQFQAWMGAVLAASMQAAGFYKNIEFKGINTSGILSRAGDFDDRNDSQLEDALESGLMPAKRALTGGYIWASDQTTYGRDNNFVFNSVQAVYAADTVSLTTAQRMETAFAGQSVADISRPVAQAFLESIMADMLRLKLIAPSDDAPKGFKNPSIKIIGNAMLVSVEIKLATAIDFIAIDFLVAPVVQAA